MVAQLGQYTPRVQMGQGQVGRQVHKIIDGLGDFADNWLRTFEEAQGELQMHPETELHPAMRTFYETLGHSTETCRALKHRIQDLIDSKWLEFKDAVPTITGNPLPNHGNQGINVLEQDDVMTIVDKVEGIKTPLKNIFNAMCHHGLVETVEGRVHEDDGFKGGTPSYAAPPRRAPHLYMEAMVTGQPSPFPYQSDKAVPWKYQSDSGAGSGHVDEVVNIAGVGNMTRSGRVYSPVDTPKKIINTSKGGERDVETTEDRTEVEQDDLFPQNESFVRTGFVHPDMVAMVEEYQLEDGTKHVYQCTPGKKLSNWTEEDVASSVYFTM
ncbi:hypothetical protein Lal_00038028 [Lupinus albus]|nr:hypothetical protein Lal_00038028 [Lupinus albus]